MSHERANPPDPSQSAAGGQPASADDLDQTAGSGAEAGMAFDYIDEAIEETMIASDPPAFNPGTGIGPPAHDKSAAEGRARPD